MVVHPYEKNCDPTIHVPRCLRIQEISEKHNYRRDKATDHLELCIKKKA